MSLILNFILKIIDHVSALKVFNSKKMYYSTEKQLTKHELSLGFQFMFFLKCFYLFLT